MYGLAPPVRWSGPCHGSRRWTHACHHRNHQSCTWPRARIVEGGWPKPGDETGRQCAVVDDGGTCWPSPAWTAPRPALHVADQGHGRGDSARPLGQPAGAAQPDILLSLSLQNAAAAGGGRMTSLKGGVPIVVDGQVVGAVGVGGGTGDQDSEVARAGIAALEKILEKERK